MLFTERVIREVQLNNPWRDAVVSVSGYFYAVDLGYGVHPQHHRVGTDLKFTCGLRAECPAVQSVEEYLQAGGEPAFIPPPGYFPVAPQSCPVCGAGWAYARGSETHYWQYHVNVLKGLFAANPWLLPPVVAPDGRVLYAGVRRDEVVTEDTLARE